MKFKNLVVLSLAVLFVACVGDIPKCGDEAVQNALKEDFFEELKKQGFAADELKKMKTKIIFNSFMGELTDEEEKAQHCKAKMVIYPVDSSENSKEIIWFEYSAKYADNKDEVVVDVEWP